jgi:hypothetical protein
MSALPESERGGMDLKRLTKFDLAICVLAGVVCGVVAISYGHPWWSLPACYVAFFITAAILSCGHIN